MYVAVAGLGGLAGKTGAGGATATDADGVPLTPRGRRDFYQAKREQLRYQREVGELITKVEAEQYWLAIADFHTTALKAIPGQLVSKLVGKSSAQIWRARRGMKDDVETN